MKKYIVKIELVESEDGKSRTEILEFVTSDFDKTYREYTRNKAVSHFDILESTEVVGKSLLLG